MKQAASRANLQGGVFNGLLFNPKNGDEPLLRNVG
jgi:hypothetical protein